LADNLKLFGQFAHLRSYFFKAQIAKAQIALEMCNANCATLNKIRLNAQRQLRNVCTNYEQYAQTPSSA